MPKFLEKGYVSRSFSGIVGLPLDAQRAVLLGVDIDQRLLIQEIYRGSPV
jgi:hypothetical protein